MLLLPGKVLCASLVDASQRGRHHPAFRYCRQCLSLGHHSVTYQMSVRTGVPLTDGSLRRNASIAGGRHPTSSTRVLWAHRIVARTAARFTRPDLLQLLQRSQRCAKSTVLPSLDISTIAWRAAFVLALTIATGNSRVQAAGAVREKLPMIDGEKLTCPIRKTGC